MLEIRPMGAASRIGVIILVAVVSVAAGWWLHRPKPGTNEGNAPIELNVRIRAPAVDATPEYFIRMHAGGISPDELHRLKKEALAGSPTPLFRLIRLYDDCASMEAYLRKPPICGRQFVFWYQIARENGATVGANLAFIDLEDSQRCEDVYRARFWLNKQLAVQPGTLWKEASERLMEKERRCG